MIGSDDMFEEQIVCLHPLDVPKDLSEGKEQEESVLTQSKYAAGRTLR